MLELMMLIAFNLSPSINKKTRIAFRALNKGRPLLIITCAGQKPALHHATHC
jgi:hypothetical protein